MEHVERQLEEADRELGQIEARATPGPEIPEPEAPRIRRSPQDLDAGDLGQNLGDPNDDRSARLIEGLTASMVRMNKRMAAVVPLLADLRDLVRVLLWVLFATYAGFFATFAWVAWQWFIRGT